MSAIFPESSLSPKLAEAIARQTGASADHTLYGDSLGPEGSPGATYLGMEARQRRRDGRRLHRRAARMPAEPMSADARALIEAEGLAVGYGGGAAIAEVGFSLRGGERMALLGPNGGGKTTLLRALLGELRPLRGTLRVAARCATVPQTERTRLDYPVSALDVAAMGALSRLPWWRRPGRAEREQARAALERVGLGAAGGGDLRRALRRPAPAHPDRPRPRPGRPGAAPRRALHRARPPRLGAARRR